MWAGEVLEPPPPRACIKKHEGSGGFQALLACHAGPSQVDTLISTVWGSWVADTRARGGHRASERRVHLVSMWTQIGRKYGPKMHPDGQQVD